MKIRDLLNMKDFKHRTLVSIGPGESVAAAVARLTEHDRGSLVVLGDKGELLGILTERDIVRKVLTRNEPLSGIKVQEIMTKQVAVGSTDDELDYAVSVMRQKRIRHLPIVDGQKVVGVISMRDLLGVQLEETNAEIRYAGQTLGKRTGIPRLDINSNSL